MFLNSVFILCLSSGDLMLLFLGHAYAADTLHLFLDSKSRVSKSLYSLDSIYVIIGYKCLSGAMTLYLIRSTMASGKYLCLLHVFRTYSQFIFSSG